MSRLHRLTAPAGFLPHPLSLALMTAMSLVSAAAQADEVAAAAADELATMVVTASRTATTLGETPAPITRLDADTIEAAKPRLISDVLDRVPGVHMVDLGNEQHSMSIRQPITTNAFYQYLEDNVPIRPIGVFNHNALNEINLAGTADIEVMRGPTSSLYGSNAVGGAVNFLTRAPSATPEAWLGLRSSDQGYRRIDLGASGTSGDLGARLSFYRSEVRDGWREYSDGDKNSLSVRLDYAVSDSSVLQNTISYTDMYTDMTGSLGESDYQKNPEKSYQHFTERTDEAVRVGSTLDTDWGSDRRSLLTLFWRDNSHGQIPSYQLGSCAPGGATCTTNGRQNDNAYTSLGFIGQWQQPLPLPEGRLIAGLGWDHTDNSYDEDNLTVVRGADLRYLSYTVGSKRRLYEAGIDNPSAFLQAQFRPLAKTTLVGGVRYDIIRYDFDNLLTPSATTGAADEKRDFSNVSPRLGLVHEFSAKSEVFVNASEGFVPPEVSQLYSSLAVPNLREATYRNYDLGFRQRFESGHVELTAYRMEGEDEITSYTISINPRVTENRNIGSSLHEGLELGASWQMLESVALYASATYARHTYESYRPSLTENYDGNDMPGAPRHFGTGGVDWQALPGFTVTPELQYLGAYWMNDANTVRYPGHSLVNLKARWVLGGLELYGQGLNLANRHYAHSASSTYRSGAYAPDTQNSYTPGDPRTFLLGFNYKLGF